MKQKNSRVQNTTRGTAPADVLQTAVHTQEKRARGRRLRVYVILHYRQQIGLLFVGVSATREGCKRGLWFATFIPDRYERTATRQRSRGPVSLLAERDGNCRAARISESRAGPDYRAAGQNYLSCFLAGGRRGYQVER